MAHSIQTLNSPLDEVEPPITGERLLGLRQNIGLNRPDFARMVGLSERSIANWESGVDLKGSSLRTIIEVERLYKKLHASFPSSEELAIWLKTSNQAFAGSQPIQVIERGEIDRLWRMIYFLESGTPS